MRNTASGTSWGPFTDSLALTEVLGNYNATWSNETYSMAAEIPPMAELLFISGDKSAWCVLSHSEVVATNESLTALNATVVASGGGAYSALEPRSTFSTGHSWQRTHGLDALGNTPTTFR